MRIGILFTRLLIALIATSWSMRSVKVIAVDTSSYMSTAKRDLLCILMTYQEHMVNVEKSGDGRIYVITKSGRRILYDDKKVKSFQEKLENSDLQDSMEQIYPMHDIDKIMPDNVSPGRIRSYELLQEVYGVQRGRIESNLVPVRTAAGTVMFNKCSGAAEALAKVMKELSALAQSNRKVSAALYPMSGTFNYRHIAGTNRLSPHSFGIAIDLSRDKRDYWKWASKKEGEKRLQAYPREVVQCFEKHGFIWGGKWSQFDILHFEYRPEIIMKSKYYSNCTADWKNWCEGMDTGDSNIMRLKDLIDEKIKE